MRATGDFPREILHAVDERMPESARELLRDSLDLDHELLAHQVPIRSIRIGMANRNATQDRRSATMLAPNSMTVVDMYVLDPCTIRSRAVMISGVRGFQEVSRPKTPTRGGA